MYRTVCARRRGYSHLLHRAYWASSKNFSFWTVPLGFFAMLKIKSLMYKDLIFNSRGCRKSNQLLRHPHRFCLNQRHPCPYWRRVLILRLKHRFTDRMSVVLSSIEFLVGKTRSSEMSTDGHFWTLPSWGGFGWIAPIFPRRGENDLMHLPWLPILFHLRLNYRLC